MGITEIQNITYGNLTKIVSGQNPEDFWLRVNTIVFGGILYFIMLIGLWFLIYRFAQMKEDQPLNNMFYASLITSIFAFFTRAIYGVLDGFSISLLTDAQLWIFPVITIILGTILWASKPQ